MIECRNLNYRYAGDTNAIDSINASIAPGIHLLMGANGAGKTTLLHLLAGLLFPTSGECLLDGAHLKDRRPSTMAKVFFLGEDMIWPAPTINRLVETHAIFYPGFDEGLLRSNLLAMGLTGSEPLRSLSLGNRKKAAAAYALALRPEVLLLDEPANGLDISAKKALQKIILQSVDESQTVVISTHTVWDLQNLFEGVMLLKKGRLVINHSVGHILDRLAFVASAEPSAEALYIEEGLGGYQLIVPNDGSLSTDINFSTLYSAMAADTSCRQITSILNKIDNHDYDNHTI